MSSLSMRGIWRVEAKAWAKVDLPVPGWPFIAITNGFLSSCNSLAIFSVHGIIMLKKYNLEDKVSV